jgi:hypothetical protein
MNDGVMSVLGQTRRFRDVRGMSGLPPTADISGHGRHFAFVPEADSASHATYPPSIVRLEPVMKPALALAR